MIFLSQRPEMGGNRKTTTKKEEEIKEMPKFLAVHPLTTPMTIEEGTPLAKKVCADCTIDAYWLGSWAQLNDEGKIVKIFCRWNGVNADAIRQVLAKTPELPTEGVYPMATLDSGDFR